jgi:mRNA interferase RelE/StbE
LQATLKEVAKNPDRYIGDWKPLKGEPFWRLRQGSYRAICSVDDGKLVLLVLKVGPRGDVYK